MTIPAIFDYTPAELTARLTAMGEPPYRARQILHGVYRRGATAYADMTDVPLSLREQLTQTVPLYQLETVARLDSSDGHTRKTLFRLADGRMVEAVLMEYLDPEEATPGRRTVCVSSQAGCA